MQETVQIPVKISRTVTRLWRGVIVPCFAFLFRIWCCCCLCCARPKRGAHHRRRSTRGLGDILNVHVVKETDRADSEKDELGNTIINGEYLINATIEQGSYGKIKLARKINSGELYAVKIYNKTLLKRKLIGIKRGVAFDNVQREIAIMRQMNHKNVVRLHEVIDDPEHDKIYLVMEYVKGGPVMKLEPDTKPLPEETAKRYFCDIVSGLEYLHSLHIAHRDLKPDNLLVTEDGTVKICDFSVSQSFDDNDDRLTYSAGSPVFLSPELCEAGTTPHGRAADIWALGVCLYCFIFGTCPFLGNNIVDIYQKIRHDEIKIPKEISPALADLLHKLLTKNPKQRITISEIKDHPWVRGIFPKSRNSSSRRRR